MPGPLALMELLEPATTETLFAQGTRRRYARGRWLFHEGDASGRVFVITAGIVKVLKVADTGRASVLGFREAGSIVGEQSALDGEPMLASATALTDVEAVVIPAAHFVDTVAAAPDLAMALIGQMSRRLRQSARLMHDIATADAVTRVANRLIDLTADRQDAAGAPTRVDIPVSQQDLAEWSGLSREAVVRALRVLRDRGTIETGRLSVTVLDHQALAEHGRVDLGST